MSLLTALAMRRAVIVQLDDVHWGVEGMLMVEALTKANIRAMVITTISDDGVLNDQVLAGLADPKVEVVEIGPLDNVDIEAMIQRGLGLDPAAVASLRERVKGNPQTRIVD